MNEAMESSQDGYRTFSDPEICKSILLDLNLHDLDSKSEDLQLFLQSIKFNKIEIESYWSKVLAKIKNNRHLENVVGAYIRELSVEQYTYMVNYIFILDVLTEILVNNISAYYEVDDLINEAKTRNNIQPSYGFFQFF